MNKFCQLCKHTLEDNMHGFDQNDGYLDEDNKLVHSGHCTYCIYCKLDAILKVANG